MRTIMSSSPEWSENFLIFHITYDSCLVITEIWISGSEPTLIWRSAFVQQLSVRKGLDEIIIIIIKSETVFGDS